jgi:uncharacterized protein
MLEGYNMEYRMLGETGIKVSRLCFGSLTIGPMQANLSLEDGSRVLIKAFDSGVNFIDSAKLYNTYPYIRKAVEIYGRRDIVISSRSYDYTYDGMKESVLEAINKLGVSYIDIFGLHEQESLYTLKGHMDALKYLIEAKEKGIIRAISISTHNVKAVEAACMFPEIDIIHPILNYKGIGIGDGTVSDMLKAIENARKSGKGIYSMKPIGGGNLIGEVKKCFSFVLENQSIDSVAVGMQSENEVACNIFLFEGKDVPQNIENKLRNTKRRLLIDEWCEGCGSCAQRCSMKALEIVNGKCTVKQDICRLCGYCSTVCPQFCIKII